MWRWILLLMIVLGVALGILFYRDCCHARAGQKYAVLISTEKALASQLKNSSEFWYDVVLTYCTLIKNDFRPENILVLYGDGRAFSTGEAPYYDSLNCDGNAGPGRDNPIIPLTNKCGLIVRDNICNVLCCMTVGRPSTTVDGRCVCSPNGSETNDFSCTDRQIPRLLEEDFLFVWLKGHASAESCQTSLVLEWGNTLSDSELKNLLAPLLPDHRTLFLETCDSGGWLDDLESKHSVILASSGNPEVFADCRESSYPAFYLESAPSTAGITQTGVLHGRFTYWVDSALQQHEPQGRSVTFDADLNNLISTLEAYGAADAGIRVENQAGVPTLPDENGRTTAAADGTQTPAISDRGHIAPCLFISLARPSTYCGCLRRIPR